MLKNSELGQAFSKALGRVFRNVPVHPNAITASSAVFALAGYLAYDYYGGWVSFALFALALLADAVDGAVARERGLESRKGAFIDGVFDRVVEFFMILTLLGAPIPVLILQKQVWLLLVLFFGAGLTGYIKAYAEHTGVMHHARAVKMPGMLERAARVLLLMLVFFLVLTQSPYSAVVLMFTAVLALLTSVERFSIALGSKD